MKKRIAILTPTYNNYSSKTRKCLDVAVEKLKERLNFALFKNFEVYIHAGRRKLLQDAIEYSQQNHIDYYLWLDSDIEFKPDDITILTDLIEILERPVIASGLYFSRHGRHQPMVGLGNENTGYYWDTDWSPGRIYTSEEMVCGLGFCMMPDKVIDKYTENYTPTRWFDSSRWFPKMAQDWARIYVIGEDIDFIEKARKIGIQLFLDTRIELIHAGFGRKDWDKKGSTVHCPSIVEEYE